MGGFVAMTVMSLLYVDRAFGSMLLMFLALLLVDDIF